jgi:alpha-1,6-mannosyl-glycoprotein beta-1,2-N-acetylglucosaminyltransferase
VSHAFNGTSGNSTGGIPGLTIAEILRNIHKYNLEQTVHNEDIFGPIQNDTLIIVIQVSYPPISSSTYDSFFIGFWCK